jgi:hypothetical protein
MVLQDDKDVLKQLLTTRRVVSTIVDETYFGRRLTKEEHEAVEASQKKREEAERERLKELRREISELESKVKVNGQDEAARKTLDERKKLLDVAEKKAKDAKANRQRGLSSEVASANLRGPLTHARVGRPSFGAGSMKPERMLATAPEGERLGLLTHPSWLVSHSDAMDNHAIHRGIWIRERLLGGGIPDVPITVDAQLPNEPHRTLRERMRVTREKYCWNCHQKMDPLGLPFEMYNHAGLFRTTEMDRPVDSTGEIIDSGDAELDGPVNSAFEMIRKLAGSERVEQVFVRHAFRFWMGRNETINDGPVLQAAHRAYRENGGSMKALITSLVTSDAFLYRRVVHEEPTAGSGR